MNIDSIINQALSMVQEQSAEKTAAEQITTHPTATTLRKMAAEIRQSDQEFKLEDLQKIASLISTDRYVANATMQKRAHDAWYQGYIEGHRVFDLFEKHSMSLSGIIGKIKNMSPSAIKKLIAGVAVGGVATQGGLALHDHYKKKKDNA
jgi:hypothetical protein